MSLFNSLIPTFDRAPAAAANGQPSGANPGVKPAYEVTETPEAFGLTVYLPGVAKDAVEITAESDQLRIVGRRAWKQPEGWTALYRESTSAPFELVLAHENALELEKVHAELRDGVLRLALPKAETVKPRKISVA
jgi:HSP20 family molecular chaperone IbpA